MARECCEGGVIWAYDCVVDSGFCLFFPRVTFVQWRGGGHGPATVPARPTVILPTGRRAVNALLAARGGSTAKRSDSPYRRAKPRRRVQGSGQHVELPREEAPGGGRFGQAQAAGSLGSRVGQVPGSPRRDYSTSLTRGNRRTHGAGASGVHGQQAYGRGEESLDREGLDRARRVVY